MNPQLRLIVSLTAPLTVLAACTSEAVSQEELAASQEELAAAEEALEQLGAEHAAALELADELDAVLAETQAERDDLQAQLEPFLTEQSEHERAESDEQLETDTAWIDALEAHIEQRLDDHYTGFYHDHVVICDWPGDIEPGATLDCSTTCTCSDGIHGYPSRIHVECDDAGGATWYEHNDHGDRGAEGTFTGVSG